MTFYCSTNDCLRGYILKYFGEVPPPNCNNCGSCKTNFETVDVTVSAQKTLSCVYRMKERYGVSMVIDTLRGSKNERVLRLGFDKLSTYGICEQSEQQLRAITNHLILSGYLVKTDDEYPVIRLGERANEVLRGSGAVHMKLPKEKEISVAKHEERKAVKVDRRLFDVLRDLRRRIANEQNLPAYVIFHDSTLTDMCIKTPTTPESLLSVSGVGQAKAERYGKQFMDAIVNFLRDNNLEEMPSGPSKGFDPATVEITDEPVTVNMVADRINCVLIENGYKKISGQRVNSWLIAEGYITTVARNDKSVKIPTEKGRELGINSEERFIRGEQVEINLYGRNAQEHIVNNSLRLL